MCIYIYIYVSIYLICKGANMYVYMYMYVSIYPICMCMYGHVPLKAVERI